MRIEIASRLTRSLALAAWGPRQDDAGGRADANLLLWSVVAVALVRQVVALGHAEGIDLIPIRTAVVALIHHQDIYGVHRANGPNAFVYPPSALLLMLPVGFISFAVARYAFELIDVVAVLAAGYIAVRLFGFERQSAVIPLVAIVLLVAAPATDAIETLNVSCLVALFGSMFLRSISRPDDGQAGVWLGLSLALKPMLLPLIVVLALARRWRAAFIALVIPVGGSTLALIFMRRPGSLVRDIAANVQDNSINRYNISLEQTLAVLGAPPVYRIGARLLVVCLAGAVFWLIWRRSTDAHLRWVELASVAMIGVMLANSFTWAHYALVLVPLMISALHRDSVARSGLACVALAVTFSPDIWANHLLGEVIGGDLDQLRYAPALILLLLAMGVRALALARGAHLAERRTGGPALLAGG